MMRMKMQLVCAVLMACTAGFANRAGAAAPEPASLVFTDGNIITMNASRAIAEAVAVRGNQIVAVGTNLEVAPYIGKNTKVLHLYGKTLLPGFIDAHAHPIQGAIDLAKCSADDVAMSVATLAAKIGKDCVTKEINAPANKWIEVVKVNPTNFIATSADLDKISSRRPVILESIDGHASWVNSVALKLLKITDSTPNPAGGRIDRDAKGHATGLLEDDAQTPALSAIPVLPLAQRVKWSVKAFDLFHAHGVTSVQDALVGPPELEVFDALLKANLLHTRVRATLKSVIGDDEAEYRRLAGLREKYAGQALFRADAVKIYTDGVVEFPNQTAAMMEPYLDSNGNPTTNYGGRYFNEEVLNKYVTRLDRDGFTVHVHSVGDYTTHASLNAFQAAWEANGPNDNRHQITHLQFVDPVDYPRFAQYKVFANMQLYWAAPEDYSVDATKPYINAERFLHMYPARSLKDAGAVIVGSSDWDVDATPTDLMPNTPLAAMQVGLTRKNTNPDSKYVGQVLNADEAVDLDTMLAAYTINAARALKQEQTTGSIEVGKLADLVVLGRNPITSPALKLIEIPVLFTIFDGAIVFQLNPGGVSTGH